ncbi:Arylsulfatase [Stieleria bergensis]|uniref:Arylsulfatase n=1 Tax=Stieleria bergensis TaxID=2528025 RepID=A0A517T341_9BACT|nr:Arylsulfatase [Planctomycetes bacterium SV_7m_r]
MIDRFARLLTLFAAILFFTVTSSIFRPVSAQNKTQPDIILIMADDVGIEGLGCYGGASYRTPSLDALAEQGVRFTHAYSQPLCTPTRVELMTGLDNHRNWLYFGILRPDANTFGHAMQKAGYRTGIFGKWQLQSYDPPDFPNAAKRRRTGMHPKDAGFDQYALFHSLHTEDKGSRYANPTMLEGVQGQSGELKTYDGQYGEDVWVNKILQFLDQPSETPRFVYYPMALPHWPFQPTPDTPSYNPTVPQETDLKYAKDMIEYMDSAVGNLVTGLKQRDRLRETILIFYSDNGTHLDVRSTMQDGRVIAGGKATPRQTGIHVPLIVHCPARFQPQVRDDLVEASDFFPTLLDLANASQEAPADLDGQSFLPVLKGQAGTRDAAFFWYDPRPGWDKDRFDRHVFALNRTHKLFRNGQLFRLGPKPLQESLVRRPTRDDVTARRALQAVIDQALLNVNEPPLVDAFGDPL